ncbi:MAG: NADH-quinone oxidoreductase subunit NuoG [Gammaproteobacteria bacterium]|nr:NADH-quinone oxidoreductase subunit NuoG [Gammaproteobacteria bacterium]
MSTQPEKMVETVNIEVDGQAMEVPKNSMIIEATDKAGISIPRFCYHSKLSIAANCRMCLVDVEKAPKPMPACATPVMDGMKIYTQSRRAIDAQHGVMEFLLINHPLDCPICDQGGECELQDLAMGYGRSVSRFSERKRVVDDHDIGPLVQTDLTRCIQCTRCVRFLDEIAGTNELGMFGRGDRSEIGTSLSQGIDSELSGNVIDLCPVGALTNKPFRFSARPWELMARPSLAAHDGVGSSLWYHTRSQQVMRAVPRENESTNETWLADRDRYSHFGLASEDRVLEPMIKLDGEWQTLSWDEGIRAATKALRTTVTEHGGSQLGVLMSASASTEEYFLAQRLARELDCPNIDHRLREQDFSDDTVRHPGAAFQSPMAAIDEANAILLVGSNIRHEAPILGQRVRKAWRAGAQVAAINPVDWNFHFSLAGEVIAAPQHLPAELAALAKAVAAVTGKEIPESLQSALGEQQPGEAHEAIAAMLNGDGNRMLILGQSALAHSQAAWLRRLSAWIAEATGAVLNMVPHGGNSTGAGMAGALPYVGPGGSDVEHGNNVRDMLSEPLKGYLLWDIEPDFDLANPALSAQALGAAETVVAVAAFASDGLKANADIILPLAPLAESEGLFYTVDGQSFAAKAAVRPAGQARPGWKILRRLGEALELDGFTQVDITALRDEMLAAIKATGPLAEDVQLAALPANGSGLYRLGDVAMYAVDGLCRRSEYLQNTSHAETDFVGLNADDAGSRGLVDGRDVKISQGAGSVTLPVRIFEELPAGAVWVKSATNAGIALGDSFGPISVEAV